MRDRDVKITPSIIDRLIDMEPKLSSEAPKSRSQSLQELKQSVRRDIEWLLNSRNTNAEIPEGLKEVRKSLAAYGLPDFTTMSSKDVDDRKELIDSVEDALKFFEPRIMKLKVILDETDIVNRGVRFKIQGVLRVEPTPEPVVFDTVLQTGIGEFEITEG